MGTHFYIFVKNHLGNLLFWNKIEMKYYEQDRDNRIFIKDTEIESYVANFVVSKYKTVKSGKSWLKNHLK